MSTKSVRYFQLTPEILLEYDYADYIDSLNQEGQTENVYDLYENDTILASVVENKYNNNTRNFLYSIEKYKPHFVLPANLSESKFVQCVNSNGGCIWDSLSGNITKTDISGVATENTSDVLFDRFRLHFTSRNYMGDYDGIILRATIYDKSKNKISLLSHYIRKTENVEINANPTLINQKLYTTYLDFEIPSAYGLLDSDVIDNLPGETVVRTALSSNIMDNTPIVFSVYGVKSTAEVGGGFEIYNVERLNAAYIPSQDNTDNIEIVIEESESGDYFEIYPEVNDGEISFSDYLAKISNDNISNYVVFHEITLTENYTDSLNHTLSKTTHREQYIVNAESSDDSLEINEDALEEHMIYRPVALYSATDLNFVITDTMRILNTLDNTTIVKSSSLTYSNPKKYGAKLSQINVSGSTINVYNKKNDIDTDSIKITNGGSNVTIANHQHSIIGFVESINVGVSIEQISTEDL